MSIYYLVDTTKRVEKSKEFAKQIIEYNQQQQEEAKQKEIEKQAKIPKLTEQGKENIKNIYHTDKKVAYLTFDDGPSNNTHQILDILKAKESNSLVFEIVFIPSSILSTARHEKSRRNTAPALYDDGLFLGHGRRRAHDGKQSALSHRQTAFWDP